MPQRGAFLRQDCTVEAGGGHLFLSFKPKFGKAPRECFSNHTFGTPVSVKNLGRNAHQQVDKIHVPVRMEITDAKPASHFEVFLKLDCYERVVESRSTLLAVKAIPRV